MLWALDHMDCQIKYVTYLYETYKLCCAFLSSRFAWFNFCDVSNAFKKYIPVDASRQRKYVHCSFEEKYLEVSETHSIYRLVRISDSRVSLPCWSNQVAYEQATYNACENLYSHLCQHDIALYI